jgi:hypothetical protein
MGMPPADSQRVIDLVAYQGEPSYLLDTFNSIG